MLKRDLSPIAVYCTVLGALILCIVGVQYAVLHSDDARRADYQRIPAAYLDAHVEFFLLTLDDQPAPPVFDAGGILLPAAKEPARDPGGSVLPLTRADLDVMRNEAIDEMRRGGLAVSATPSKPTMGAGTNARERRRPRPVGEIGAGETGWPGGNGRGDDPRARSLRVEIRAATRRIGGNFDIQIATEVRRCLYASHDDNMGIAAVLFAEQRTLIVPASSVRPAIESNVLRMADGIAQAFNPIDTRPQPARPF